ncbi:MAG: PAS domain S-box protein [Leptospiraceae bacterium]|nr:PAS domain S-box protein [Leptospiraceae bacterium]
MFDKSNKTILLVEDEIIIAMMELKLLEKEGYRVIHAANGEEAIDIVNNSPIDLILMDIDLGKGMDGTETAREILRTHNLPIVFLSSRTEKDIVQKTEVITSYGYIMKNSGIIVMDASIKMAFKLHEANERTQREKEQLRTILHSIGDAVIATNREGLIVRMNIVAEEITGWKFSEVEGRPLYEIFRIINAHTREIVPDPVKLVLATGNTIGLANHTVLIARDGTECQIADSGAPIKDVSGNIIGVVLVFRDVTQEYEIQNKIEISERKYRTIIDVSPIPYALNDDHQNILLINKAFTETFGYSHEDIPTLSDWWPKAYPDLEYRNWVASTWQNNVEKSLRDGKPFIPLEIIIQCKDGTKRSVMASAVSLGDSFSGIHLVILYDITDRKKNEDELRVSKQLLEASQSIAKLGGWELDLTTNTLYWTAETYRIHETSPSEFNPTVDAGVGYFLPESRQMISEALKNAIEKGIGYDLELETFTTKGRKIDVRTTCHVTIVNGKPAKLTGIFQDITVSKLAGQEIRNLLQEKEIILKEVHHRVKNNMSTIFGLLTTQAVTVNDLAVQSILQDSAGRVQSMMVLYDKLYRSENAGIVSIKDYFPSLIFEIISLFPKTKLVKIETELDDIRLKTLVVTPLGIIFNELITNTMKYAFSENKDGLIRVTAKQKENLIILTYEDNGKGIPSFISFDKPTGFGLLLIKMLVKQINGTISMEIKNGTCFVIEFHV